MTDVATKDDIADAMSAWAEFKTANDERLAQIEAKLGGADPVTIEKLGKLEASLDTAEAANQKLTQAVQQQKLKTEATLDALEVKFSRLCLGEPRAFSASKEERRAEVMAKADAWSRGVHVILRDGRHGASVEQLKAVDEVIAQFKSALRPGTEAKALDVLDDAQGGYLAPVDFVAEILKTVVLISPVRSLARIRTTANKSMRIPKRTALLAASWDDEEEVQAPAQGLQYGLIEVFTRGLRAIVDISNDMLEDAAFDMAAEILAEVTEQFAVSEGAAFVNGAGPNQPEGFLTNAAITGAATHTGNAVQLTSDSVLGVFHALKTAYARNAVWAMSRPTVGQMRQLKDGVGQYLFMMGLPNGAPNTILGAPYVEVPDMPAVAAGAYPVAIGDFNRGYSLVDRIAMQMIRDPYTQAASNNVRYYFRRRLGGKVTMPEAIQALVVSA